MAKKTKTLEEQLYYIGLAFLILGSIAILVYMKLILPNITPIPCMLYRVLGLYCPGCGGTRAVDALLHGHIFESLWYHPLVLYTIVIFGGFMLTQTFERLHIWRIKGWKFHEWHLFGALGIVVINWILKNILLLCFDITL